MGTWSFSNIVFSLMFNRFPDFEYHSIHSYSRISYILLTWTRVSTINSELFKLMFSSFGHRWPLPMLANLFRTFCFFALKTYFGFERAWWTLFQKRVVRSKFHIYVFIILVVKGSTRMGPWVDFLIATRKVGDDKIYI